MLDLLRASDLGIVHHITMAQNSFDTKSFYSYPKQNILNKISHLSCDLDDRDFELARAKPLLPIGFKIKQDIPVRHNLPLNSKPLLQSQANYTQKYDQKTPHSVPKENTDRTDFFAEKIMLAQKIAKEATHLEDLLEKIHLFQSGLDSQKFSIKTLAYDDANQIDILWINDSVSFDDDKNHRIMSDKAGNMIVDLFETLGYGRSVRKKYGQIGYTVLSFWAFNEKNTPQDNSSNLWEYQICLPFVQRLIYFLNPKKIILSGDMVLKYISSIDNENALSMHGKKVLLTIDDKQFDAFVAFNCSYILNSEVIKKLFWFDLLKILNDNT